MLVELDARFWWNTLNVIRCYDSNNGPSKRGPSAAKLQIASVSPRG